ncbi:ion transporter [bacterium]|nr:ion transporter [bacterium]
MAEKSQKIPLRQRAYRIIFESDTPAGRAFDVVLLIVILLSVVVVMAESVDPLRQKYGTIIRTAEWIFTIIFTIEYFARLWCVPSPGKYARSFFGIVDFLGFIPTYISVFLPGTHFLMVIRIVRFVRIFRIFKLARYLREGRIMVEALRASKPKIVVFLVSVISAVVVIGAVMYLVEGPENGFDSIPRSIYWAVVTMTTVGYGDISPKTPLGQFIAMVVMILGYAVIAVPTGIISFDVLQQVQKAKAIRVCPACGREIYDRDALYCKYCGAKLE